MRLTTTTIGDFPKSDYVPTSDWFQAAGPAAAFDAEFLTLAEDHGIHIQIDQAAYFCFAGAFQDRAGDLWRGRA